MDERWQGDRYVAIVAGVTTSARSSVHSPVPAARCRLTVLAAHHRADLVLPATVPIAAVLSDLVRLVAEPERAERAAAPLHWALGRLGDPPMALERTLADYGVLDGETLHLTDAAEPLGPALTEPAGADGLGADGLGADGLGADGLGADGLGAAGLGSAGLGSAGRAAVGLHRSRRAAWTLPRRMLSGRALTASTLLFALGVVVGAVLVR